VARPSYSQKTFDRELLDLTEPLRRREFMMRVEAIIFASAGPVLRETLAGIIGSDCNLDLIIADIRDELRSRPYDLQAVAGGFQHRTRAQYAEAIRASGTVAVPAGDLSPQEQLVLTAIAYFQPITRAAVSELLGKEISRDVIAVLRRAELVATGPRSPQPGAPHTYVTTQKFLVQWGLENLRDLPELERLEDAGLIGALPSHDDLSDALGVGCDDGIALD
jgi:segregation and condensation protein B